MPETRAAPGGHETRALPAASKRGASDVLQEKVRLSESMLWSLQRAYYDEAGVEAWRRGDIPSLATTNAFLARVYAEAVLAYLLDNRGSIDPGEPVYLVELGAGAGRLGFLVVKTLKTMRRLYPELDGLRLVYVLSDAAAPNVRFWQQHPPLRHLSEGGDLRFALWSSSDGGRIALQDADGQPDTVLEASSTTNPLVVVANYVFDSLPADAFHVRAGQLHESLVKITAPRPASRGAQKKSETPVLPDALELAFSDRRIEGAAYPDPELEACLAVYPRELSDASVLFPVGALRAVQTLLDLAGDRLLLLAADKGEAHLRAFRGIWDWELTVHAGCFSFMANLHAIGELFRLRGGRALHSPDPRDSFRFSAFAIGSAAGYPALERSLAPVREGFGPADFLGVIDPPTGASPTIDHVLAILRACNFDPYVFANYEPTIDELIRGLDPDDREALVQALQRVEPLDYALGDHLDLPFLLGRIYYRLDDLPRALELYTRSLKQTGPHEATHYNLALCYDAQGRREAAAEQYRLALGLHPGYLDAEARLAKVAKVANVTP